VAKYACAKAPKKIVHTFTLAILFCAAALADAASKDEQINLPFTGVYRADAKTSIATSGKNVVPLTNYENLGALVASLPKDTVMRSRYTFLRPMHHNAPGVRVSEERRNVRIRDCWILAVKYEKSHTRIKNGKKKRIGDNDFHLVVGSSPQSTVGQRMNMEVSGLPSTSGSDIATLRRVRRDFLSMCASTPPDGKFVKFAPPIHATIEGSLFFDGEHTADQIAPAYHLRTTWEVHPISKMRELN
jgi:hypothetical protein